MSIVSQLSDSVNVPVKILCVRGLGWPQRAGIIPELTSHLGVKFFVALADKKTG
jgi:hypothetical protein